MTDGPEKGCTVYPELIPAYRALAASAKHLRNAGQPPASTQATQASLRERLAADLRQGSATLFQSKNQDVQAHRVTNTQER